MRKLLPLVAMTVLSACSSTEKPGDAASLLRFNAGEPALSVNKLPVSELLLQQVANGRGLDLSNPEQRKVAIKELSDYILLAQAAEKANAEKSPEFLAEVEASRLQGVANAMMAHYARTHPVTDDVLKGEYEQQVAKSGAEVYDFTQLMFDNEGDALAASKEILDGKPFQQVYDAWRAKAKQGKSFKAVRLSQLPAPELVAALKGLKPGEATKIPVKSQFGWHLVGVEAVQPYTPPPFDQVKNDLRRIMLSRQGDAWMEKLRGESLILDLKNPQGANPTGQAAAPGAPAATEGAAKQG
ncbi:peptidylprolyl isomerase [Tahibacter amnicola]|uniref:peptidylprolyl isomerase n=1 Tax=Tahibacter amnicola TaxID=2976241 RepID=A0ABY6B9E6_9GAMM|nr:peptidylprolyl isomerase [Tahibacter amnicola]UXI66407.1 peptidylprolyl isomerase [Tahibacter amnicola]